MTCKTPKRGSKPNTAATSDAIGNGAETGQTAREKNEQLEPVEHQHCCCGLCACECDGEHCPSAYWALTEEANERHRIRLLRRLTEAVRMQFQTRGDGGSPRRQYNPVRHNCGHSGGDTRKIFQLFGI